MKCKLSIDFDFVGELGSRGRAQLAGAPAARVHARLLEQSCIDRSIQKIGETGMDAANDKLTQEEFWSGETFAHCRDKAGAHAAVNT